MTTYEGVNRAFTEKVAEYLRSGYIINTGTMGRVLRSGEITKVDLTNGDEMIRVVLKEGEEYAENHRLSPTLDCVRLIVGHTYTVVPNAILPLVNNYIDSNDLEVICDEKFYWVTHTMDGRSIYGTKEEAVRAAVLRRKRGFSKLCNDNLKNRTFVEEKYQMVARRVIRRKLGVKHIAKSKVQVVKNEGEYQIWYGEKYWALH